MTYGELDLKSIMEKEDLDFAHFTYLPGQCSCCYGPEDLPAKYWKNGDKSIAKKNPNYTYILFKNAYNGSGYVRKKDEIKDYTCVSYRLKDMEQVYRVADLLEEQLTDEYFVEKPKNTAYCIIIHKKED